MWHVLLATDRFASMLLLKPNHKPIVVVRRENDWPPNARACAGVDPLRYGPKRRPRPCQGNPQPAQAVARLRWWNACPSAPSGAPSQEAWTDRLTLPPPSSERCIYHSLGDEFYGRT